MSRDKLGDFVIKENIEIEWQFEKDVGLREFYFKQELLQYVLYVDRMIQEKSENWVGENRNNFRVMFEQERRNFFFCMIDVCRNCFQIGIGKEFFLLGGKVEYLDTVVRRLVDFGVYYIEVFFMIVFIFLVE